METIRNYKDVNNQPDIHLGFGYVIRFNREELAYGVYLNDEFVAGYFRSTWLATSVAYEMYNDYPTYNKNMNTGIEELDRILRGEEEQPKTLWIPNSYETR